MQTLQQMIDGHVSTHFESIGNRCKHLGQEYPLVIKDYLKFLPEIEGIEEVFLKLNDLECNVYIKLDTFKSEDVDRIDRILTKEYRRIMGNHGLGKNMYSHNIVVWGIEDNPPKFEWNEAVMIYPESI